MKFDNENTERKELVPEEFIGYLFADETVQIDEDDENGKPLLEQGQLYSIEKEDGHINVRYSNIDQDGDIQLRTFTNMGQAEFEQWIDNEPLIHIISKTTMEELLNDVVKNDHTKVDGE